jgi:hypothetical protein
VEFLWPTQPDGSIFKFYNRVEIKTQHYSGDTKMTRKNKTWRVPPDHKDFEVEMNKDFQQIEDQEMHCYLAKVKKNMRPNLRKKIEGR